MDQNNKILVTGASGNLGSKVANRLIALGSQVRVNGRNAHKLNRFTPSLESCLGSLEDEAILQAAMEGVQSVFLVLPQLERLTLQEFAELFIEKANVCGITHVVNISNCTLTRWGKSTTLLDFEQYLNKAQGINIKHLRSANFFENLHWGIHTPYKEDIKLPYISAFEVAQIAASYLANKNFTAISIDELMGRKDYTMGDFAKMAGIKYKQIAAKEEDENFFNAFNTGSYTIVERTKENTSELTDDEFSLEHFLRHHFAKSNVGN